MSDYRVMVGNIGEVFQCNNPVEARKVYGEYKRLSESGYGQAAGESVVLMRDDEIDIEYVGTIDSR